MNKIIYDKDSINLKPLEERLSILEQCFALRDSVRFSQEAYAATEDSDPCSEEH